MELSEYERDLILYCINFSITRDPNEYIEHKEFKEKLEALYLKIKDSKESSL